MLGRCGVDDLPDLRTAGEEDHVPTLPQERRRLRNGTFDDGNRLTVEVAGHELRDHRRGRCGDLRRLENGGVTRGERGHERREHQLERLVPGGDDQGHTEGITPHHGVSGSQRRRELDRLRLDPLVHMLERLVGVPHTELDVHEISVDSVAAEIVIQRVVQGWAVLHKQRLQCLQLRDRHASGRVWPARKYSR
jgi:hypothetical protein